MLHLRAKSFNQHLQLLVKLREVHRLYVFTTTNFTQLNQMLLQRWVIVASYVILAPVLSEIFLVSFNPCIRVTFPTRVLKG
jgi:hypothetical protein